MLTGNLYTINNEQDVPLLKLYHSAVMPEKRGYRNHHHAEFEIGLIKAGTGIYKVGEREYPIQKGDIFLFSTDEHHCITEISGNEEMLPVGKKEDVHTGKATIRSTVAGDQIQEYSVEVLKVYPNSGPSGRNMLLKVTDPDLLATTGGIVQGMSGSPLVQDGKLIGAVTHVLVNDPTMGYGIFIENMLEAAS